MYTILPYLTQCACSGLSCPLYGSSHKPDSNKPDSKPNRSRLAHLAGLTRTALLALALALVLALALNLAQALALNLA